MLVDDLNIKDYNYFSIVYFKDTKIQKEATVTLLNKSTSTPSLDFKIAFLVLLGFRDFALKK